MLYFADRLSVVCSRVLACNWAGCVAVSSVKGFNNKVFCEPCFSKEKRSKVDLSLGCAGW